MRPTPRLLLAAITLLPLPWLCGCATLARHQHTATLHQAQQDDQTCTSQGWHYPAPRYLTCRLQLDDQRQYRNWMNLQLTKQTQFQRAGAPPAPETYRPLDRSHYECHYITDDNGKDYILCGETSSN